tara:strand:- start:196 stop:489 length:294 start_codon:yes stop_codon:yes gene_type:complete
MSSGSLLMALCSAWLSIQELSQFFGIPNLDRSYVLQKRGWRDQEGHPTKAALKEGSQSVNTTSEQMAEDLPRELIEDVNYLLAERGVTFRVPCKLTT